MSKKLNSPIAHLDYPARMAAEKLEQYYPAGVRTFIVGSEADANLLCWNGRDHYNYEGYEHELAMLLDYHDDIEFILNVGLRSCAPHYWCEDHPDELVTMDNGLKLSSPSLASRVWREESADAVARFVRHFENCPFADRIVGYNVMFSTDSWRGAGELAPDLPANQFDLGVGDFSPAMLNGFRAWLNERYGGDEQNLRSAWKDENITFASAEPPGRDERNNGGQKSLLYLTEQCGARYADYWRFYNEANTELAMAYAGAVKQASGGAKLAGCSHATCFGLTNLSDTPQGAGHGAAAMILASDNVDFLHAPYHPCNRGLDGVNTSQIATASAIRHGKTVIHFNDSGTHLQANAEKNMRLQLDTGSIDNMIIPAVAQTPEESRHLLTRDYGTALTQGSVPGWLDRLQPIFGHWFNFESWGPLSFDDPELQRHMAALHGLQPLSDGPLPDTALFISPESAYYRAPERMYGAYFIEALRQWAIPRAATPWNDYLIDDFDAVAGDYRCAIFPDLLYCDTATRKAIRRAVEHGLVAVFFHAAGWVDEHGIDGKNSEALTGIHIESREISSTLSLSDFDSAHPLTKGLPEGYTTASCMEPALYRDRMAVAPWPAASAADAVFSPVLSARQENDIEVVARIENTSLPGLAVKRQGKGAVVWSGAPLLDPRLLRNLFDFAGAHVYSDSDVSVSDGCGYLLVSSRVTEPVTIRMPGAYTLSDALTGERICDRRDTFTLEMQAGESRLLKREDS